MKYLSIFFTLFFIYFDIAYAMHKQKTPYNQVMAVINGYLTPLEKEKNIKLRGYGLHFAGPDKIYDGKIHEIDLGLSTHQKMKYEEARNLFYSIVDGLLEALNAKESIHSCFYHYPVTYQDLYLRLNFDYDNEQHLNVGDISMIAILDNEIMYFIAEEDGGNVGIEMKKISSDVYIGTGLSPKTRCVTKKLPEKLQ